MASGVPDVYNYTGFVQRVGDVVVPNSHADRPGVRKSISVQIPSLQLQDSGIYTCYVHNGITGVNTLIQSASQRIFVRASPKLFVKETVITGETSENITIAIPFVSDPEYTTFSVSKHDGQQVSTNKKYTLQITNEFVHTVFYGEQVTLTGNVLKMIITDLSEEEFGIYNIQITNYINTTNISIHVMKTRKPLPPTELTHTSMNDIFTFEWKEGFNGGHEQTFVLQTLYNSDNLWLNRTTIKESDSKYRKANKMFQANLTDLVPGIYSARLVAFNRIGATEPVTFKDTFEVIGKQKDTTHQTSVDLVIGGAVAGIVAVLVVVIFIVFVIRRKYNCICSFNLPKREDGYDDTLTDHRLDTHEVPNPGCNESHTYEALALKTDPVVYGAPEKIGTNNSDILKEASARTLSYHGNVQKGDTTL